MRFFLITVFCVFSLSTAAVAAPLSLKEAEALWREHSRVLRLAETAVGGAEGDLRAAGQRPNPDFTVNMSQLGRYPANSGAWLDKRVDTELQLQQLIERGDKRGLRQRGASARLDAAKLDLEATTRQQLAVLRHAYYDLKLAQEKQRLTAEAAEFAGRTLDAAEKRRKVGDLAPVEVSRLAIDKTRADADARQAVAELEQARHVLAYMLGWEDKAEALVAGDGWPVADDRAIPMPLPDQRPDLEAARRRAEAAEADRDLARAKRTRDVTLGVGYEHSVQNVPVSSVGVGISVPLFIWHEYEGEIARAEADASAARLQQEDLRAQAIGQLGQLRAQLLAARDRLRRLDAGLLADAQRVADAAELAYNKGAMGLLDLLDARRTLRQIQIEAATARADYAKALADWQALAPNGNTP